MLFLFEVIDIVESFGRINRYAKEYEGAVPVEETADVGIKQKTTKKLFGLIFYINDSRISVTIFESGKVVFSGAKKRKEINEIFKNLYPLLIESKNINGEEK